MVKLLKRLFGLAAVQAPQTCTVIFDRFENGYVWLRSECGQCWTLQFSYNLNGPWYWGGNGVGDQAIAIRPRDEGGPQYFRAVPRDCAAIPIPDP